MTDIKDPKRKKTYQRTESGRHTRRTNESMYCKEIPWVDRTKRFLTLQRALNPESHDFVLTGLVWSFRLVGSRCTTIEGSNTRVRSVETTQNLDEPNHYK